MNSVAIRNRHPLLVALLAERRNPRRLLTDTKPGSEKRAKAIRHHCESIYLFHEAGKTSNVEVVADKLADMKATPAEIRRAVRVLRKAGKIAIPQP